MHAINSPDVQMYVMRQWAAIVVIGSRMWKLQDIVVELELP